MKWKGKIRRWGKEGSGVLGGRDQISSPYIHIRGSFLLYRGSGDLTYSKFFLIIIYLWGLHSMLITFSSLQINNTLTLILISEIITS